MSCTFSGICSCTLGKFYSTILLNIFAVLLSLYSPSNPIIPRFGLILVSHITWIFCGMTSLDLMFSFTNDSISSILSSTPEILYSSLSFCLSCLYLQFLLIYLDFLFPKLPPYVFSLLPLFLFSSRGLFFS